MSIRPVPLVINEFFHIYNRGTDKRAIFLDRTDHQRCLDLLYLCNSEKQISVRDVKKIHEIAFDFDRGTPLVSIGAYCLMPNHFHLLLTPLVESGVSKFMSKLSTGYSMYFNKRYKRNGSLFQGKFKSQHADTDEYLKYLYAYIHLNPVKLIDSKWKERGSKDAAKSFDFAASFAYSSLPDYLGSNRPQKVIIDTKPFPDYFPSAALTQKDLFEWLEFSNPPLG